LLSQVAEQVAVVLTFTSLVLAVALEGTEQM
jgi:hypothetical protein